MMMLGGMFVKQIIKIGALLIALCVFVSILSACDAKESVSKIPLDTATGSSAVGESSPTKDTTASKRIETVTSTPKKAETSKPKSGSSEKQASKSSSSEKEKLTFSIPSDVIDIKPFGTPLPFIGKWKGSYDVANLFEYDGLPACPVECTILFYEYTPSIFDKNTQYIYKEEIDEDSFRSAMRTILPKVMQEYFKAQNITQAEFEENIGMTLSEYIGAYIEESIPLTSYSTEWKYTGGKLYIYDETKEDFEHVPYTLKGDDQLSLTMNGETITYTKVN